MISAIVLAAGEARRMGQFKLLLPWEGKTILEHVLDNLLQSQVNEVILVLGHEAHRILKRIPTQKIKVVINTDYREGMSSSLRKGLAAMKEKSTAFLVVLGDQPGIRKEIINQLIQSFHQSREKRKIVLPTYKGRRGHPVLFSIQYHEEILRLRGDIGARQILKDHPEHTIEVEIDSDTILLDIDTPEDYNKFLERRTKH